MMDGFRGGTLSRWVELGVGGDEGARKWDIKLFRGVQILCEWLERVSLCT